MSLSTTFNYRADIDGLRAIAVLAVVIFHLNAAWLPGGFIGVDVFFVISGYLITQILVGKPFETATQLIQFYERRVRRLAFPALAMCLVTVIAVTLGLSWPQLQHTLDSLFWTLGYASNVYFLGQSGYFAPEAASLPLLHTWSLAIEEQFYLLHAPLICVLRRYVPRHIPAVIGLVLLGSLGFACYLTATNQGDAAFFHSGARFWELMVGGLLVFCPPCRCSSSVEKMLTALGLLVLAGSFIGFHEGLAPLVYAPLAVMATAVLLAVGHNREDKPLLTTPALVGIGLLSYSIYLWHWPVIVLARLSPLSPLSGRDMGTTLVLVAIIGALSYASWRWLEQPIRQKRWLTSSKALWIGFALTILLVINIAVALLGLHPQLTLIAKHQQDWLTRIDAQKQAQMFRNSEEFTRLRRDHFKTHTAACSYDKGTPHQEVVACVRYRFDNQSGPKVLVLGDSFARDVYYALTSLYPQAAMAMLYQPSCMPFHYHSEGPGKPECFKTLAADLADIRHAYPDITIVVSGWWQRDLMQGLLAEQGERLFPKRSQPYWWIGAGLVLEPSLPFGVMDGSYHPANVNAYPLNSGTKEVIEANAQVKAWATQRGDYYVDKLGAFCTAAQCVLRDPRSHEFYVYDHAHLSNVGIQRLARYLSPQLKAMHFAEPVN